ncbi:MAG: putative thiol-disulfide oxidoreductase, partial [Chthoniobacteraceae bacterium]|nr:putative thiol-disulfide oxidoreductase [Chthoniobacteraceae bacterium]
MNAPLRQHIVLYDDQCPLCTFQMRLLSWLDWLNCLALVPLSDPVA